MGRSRGVLPSADEDVTQRSRRKRNASSRDTADPTVNGKKALYHCNYCNKDITGKIRIKCGVCADFDLCIECFSVGAEITPHKSGHPYRVMDSLSFPLICADWNADEEMLLLEGIEMYGMWNWAEVSEHVGTKSKEHCISHYANIYLDSPVFPCPDMSHVAGKNRKELIAMASRHSEDKKVAGEVILKEGPSFQPLRMKHSKQPHPQSGMSSRLASKSAQLKESKNCSGRARVCDESSLPNCANTEPPCLPGPSGYNHNRCEFDTEYDNDAEQLLAEMEFKDNDSEEVRELKLRVLRLYHKRLDERKRRKDFVLERNLFRPNPVEADMSSEEKATCRNYDVFMRFHSKEEHDEFLRSLTTEDRLRKRIGELKDARMVGCRSSIEADKYIGSKRKRESQSTEKDMNSSITDDLDITSFSGGDLLSEREKRLCTDIRMLPNNYLRMQEVMTIEIFSGNVAKKADAYRLFKLEPSKVDRVYDVLVKKGIAPP